MIFLNDRALAKKFKASDVPSKQRLIYLLISTVGYLILDSSIWLDPSDYEPQSNWDIVTESTLWLMTLVGTIWCYVTNSKGDDREFIERYTCLGTVIIFQVILIALVFLGVFWLMLEYSDRAYEFFSDDGHFNACIYGFTVFLFTYIFWRLNQSIRIASH